MTRQFMRILDRYIKEISPTTYEDPIAHLIMETLNETLQVLRTHHGNIIAHSKDFDREKATIMLQAHMDEVGFRPYKYLRDGFIELTPIFDISSVAHEAANQRVVFLPSKRTGVLVIKHTQKTPVCYADVGATSDSEAQELVPPYSTGAYIGTMEEGTHYLTGKSLGDRVGCAIITNLLNDVAAKAENNVIGVYTAREEGGGKPISELVLELRKSEVYPDVIINLEVCPGGPTPIEENPIATVGGGVVLCHMDKGYPTDPGLSRWVTDLAERHGIPHQHLNTKVSGGEAGSLAFGFGRKTFQLCIPERYPHAPNSVIAKKDLEAMLRLTEEFVREWEKA